MFSSLFNIANLKNNYGNIACITIFTDTVCCLISKVQSHPVLLNQADAVIAVVDCNEMDTTRCHADMQTILHYYDDKEFHPTLLVFANKHDLPNVMPVQQVPSLYR